MILRNIQVGDDLSGKTLYLSFPDNAYESFPAIYWEEIIFITFSNSIYNVSSLGLSYYEQSVDITKNNIRESIYSYMDYANPPVYKPSTFILDSDIGTVTFIDNTHPAYQYIKIYAEPTKTTVAEVNKTIQSLSVKGELIETTGTMQLTTNGNFEALEFIEGTSFQIKADGTVEASEFIEQ